VHKAPGAAVKILGVFANNDEVDIFWAFVAERRFNAGKKFHGAQIDVLIESEPQIEEQLPFEDAWSYIGVPDRAEQDGVELAKLIERVGGEGFARLEESVATPIEVGQFECKTFEFGNGFENFDSFGSDFRAGAVPANDSDIVSLGHLDLTKEKV